MLLWINLALILVSVLGELVRYSFMLRDAEMPQRLARVVSLIDVNFELNIPTWYASVMILVCAGLIALIAASKQRTAFRRHWRVLAMVFVGLSLDELAALHDSATGVVRDLLNTSGMLTLAWVVPAIVFVAIFALAYLPFLRALPRPTRIGFVTAGSLFILGAVGFEMLGAYYSALPNAHSLVYAAIWTLEEALELVAMSLFVYVLLTYMRQAQIPLYLPLTKAAGR